MRYVLICSGVAGLLSSPAGSAFAQQMVDQGAFRHHQGPGMMGDGWGFNDPTAYLDALKQYLAISSRQEVAWNQYADAVKDASAQMADAHRVMFQAMGTATWQERRDMMNRMFDARQQSYSVVHATAERLLAVLDPSQRSKATASLPGLGGSGYGMVGRGGSGQRSP